MENRFELCVFRIEPRRSALIYNHQFKREISYFRNLFLKNAYPGWFFDQSVKTFDGRNKLGTQKLKTDFYHLIEVPIMANPLTTLLIVS